jgi:hypothetical protein
MDAEKCDAQILRIAVKLALSAMVDNLNQPKDQWGEAQPCGLSEAARSARESPIGIGSRNSFLKERQVVGYSA